MNRAEKVAVVEQLTRDFSETPHIIVTGFNGLTVNQANELRRKIDEVGGSYRVVQNRLARRAAVGTPAAELAGKFQGPCALAIHASDPVALAKTMTTFAKVNPEIELLGALIDSRETVDAAGVKELATLPGLDGVRAQLLALFNTPATSLVRLLSTPGTQLARVIDARREKEGGERASGLESRPNRENNQVKKTEESEDGQS